MEPGLQLLTFSALMLLGSYVSGSLPLTVSMSELAVQRVSVVGAGLLVGTALAVIIPEGTNTLARATRGTTLITLARSLCALQPIVFH
jgi:zinc transporter 9